MPKPIKAEIAAAVVAAKPARKLTATPPSAAATKLAAKLNSEPKRSNVAKPIADANKPAAASAKPKRAAKPAAVVAPQPLTAATNNGRKPALVRSLIAGASANDAKKLRGKLRKLFGGAGTWQQFDVPANHAKLAEMLVAPMARAREIAVSLADANKPAAASAKPKRAAKPAEAPSAAAKPRAKRAAVAA